MAVDTLQTGRISSSVTAGDGSLKERLFALMQIKANRQGWLKGTTPADLAKELGSTEHHIVHLIMDSLSGAGLITYRKGRSNSIYSLRLTPPAMGKTYAPASLKNPKFAAMVKARSVTVIAEATKTTEEIYTPRFPIIEKLTGRKDRLMAMAKNLEDDAPELAIQLMEKADIPLTSLEEESVELFKAYINS